LTDYLLVHGAGQGAWSWGEVWGYMTAPVEHPPRLYARRKVGRVFPMDLPGHGTDAGEDTATVQIEECVQAIVRTVERLQLRDLVLVGHGFAGWLIMQAAPLLPQPPRRLVPVAGLVPAEGQSMLSEFPPGTRSCFQALGGVSAMLGKDLKLPREAINRYLCNGIDPMEVVQTIGYFGPLPTRVFKSRIGTNGLDLPSPATYIVLTRDRVVPPPMQRRMAGRIPNVEVLELESCHQVTQHRPRELAEILLGLA
jgi:pimeloyl-ACP methyl ester carboxylesterase